VHSYGELSYLKKPILALWLHHRRGIMSTPATTLPQWFSRENRKTPGLIGDPDDPGQVRHERYDEWLKKQLTKINSRMWAWSRKCPVCEENGERKDPPFQPNERIKGLLC
jgi:hypothetical protein